MLMTEIDLSGLRILVVEDEPVVALDLELELIAAGASVIGSATTVEAARELVRSEGLSAAVLDVQLGNEDVGPVADMLRERGVPFVFHTGNGGSADITEKWPDAPVVQKPSHPETILAAIARLLGRGQFAEVTAHARCEA
jgi:DNA-binding response OmpR family regulator